MELPRLLVNNAKPPVPGSHYTSAVNFGRGWIFNVGVGVAGTALVLAAAVSIYRYTQGSRREAVRTEIQTHVATLQASSLEEIIEFSRSLVAARELLARHPFAANIFSFLRASIHRDVQLQSLDLSSTKGAVTLGALARSYRAVGEQVRILEAHPDVRAVDFGGLARSDRGLVAFSLSIQVKESLFRYVPPAALASATSTGNEEDE